MLKDFRSVGLALCVVSSLTLVACGADSSSNVADTSSGGSTPEVSTSAQDLGGPITLDAKIAFDTFFKKTIGTDGVTDGQLARSDIRLTIQMSEHVRAVLRAKLAYNIETGVLTPEDIDAILKEAYIEVRNIGGTAVAVIVGKHPIAFGAKVPTMPTPENDPAFKIQRMEEVMGFTVALGKVGFFDLVELSAFETTPGDLKIGEFDGGAIRLTKNVTKELTMRLSAMHAGQAVGADDNRGGIGFLYASGKWTVWTDGAYMEGSKLYPSSHWYGVAGVKYGTAQRAITVQATVIENALWEIGLGAQLEIMKNTYLLPELRYRDRNGTGELVAIVRAEYRFTIK